MRLFLLITWRCSTLALLLTFSRASIAGGLLVGALFLMWKFNARSLAFAIMASMVVLVLVGRRALCAPHRSAWARAPTR